MVAKMCDAQFNRLRDFSTIFSPSEDAVLTPSPQRAGVATTDLRVVYRCLHRPGLVGAVDV